MFKHNVFPRKSFYLYSKCSWGALDFMGSEIIEHAGSGQSTGAECEKY
jgi:hypothetical protein